MNLISVAFIGFNIIGGLEQARTGNIGTSIANNSIEGRNKEDVCSFGFVFRKFSPFLRQISEIVLSGERDQHSLTVRG